MQREREREREQKRKKSVKSVKWHLKSAEECRKKIEREREEEKEGEKELRNGANEAPINSFNCADESNA